jgi:UDP-N-acetylglucosamine 2-epimerase (non-hydrolysing)
VEVVPHPGPGAPTVVYVVGARPNFVKMAPVVRATAARLPAGRHVVVHTGQHYDRVMSDAFLEDLGMPAPAHALGIGSGSHGAQTGRALERIEEVLELERPDVVVVPGDVNSTLAAALAAVKLGIPVAHLEAGLRSFDRTMPEEINRVLVDQISRWCFIHSAEAEDNLRREGVERDRIHFVGNTMIDTLVAMRGRMDVSTVLADNALARGRYALVTLHRPALVDGPLFERVLTHLAELSRGMPVVFPMHPRTRARLPAGFSCPAELRLIDPVGYVDFLALQAGARAIITDSGGVQEEATFLRVPCFTLRDNTERPVTIRQGTNQLLGLDPDAISEIPWLLRRPLIPLQPPDGWDGHAAERAAACLASALAPFGDAETPEAGIARGGEAG